MICYLTGQIKRSRKRRQLQAPRPESRPLSLEPSSSGGDRGGGGESISDQGAKERGGEGGGGGEGGEEGEGEGGGEGGEEQLDEAGTYYDKLYFETSSSEDDDDEPGNDGNNKVLYHTACKSGYLKDLCTLAVKKSNHDDFVACLEFCKPMSAC